MTDRPSPADVVSAYARAFLRQVPAGHLATSPLGAWLLLAQCAGDPGERALADALIAAPHPMVSAALALWTAPDVETPALQEFRRSLRGATTGPVPEQAVADRWASDATAGMIERFPLAIEPLTVLVLANALATRVTWQQPLGVVDARDLDGPFAAEVTRALSSAWRPGQRALLAETSIGLVAAHVADAAPAEDGSGLAVVSVIADEGIGAADLHGAALDVTAHLVTGSDVARVIDLFDAPDTGPAWSIETGTATVVDGSDRVSRALAVLPAWSARTDLDLLPGDGTAFGLDAAVHALQALLPPTSGPFPAAARQSAYAAFTRTGFEAAAVSAIGLARGAMPGDRREVPARTLTVRFGRPYAVCAVATGGGPWHGVPVFSAWVEHPDPVD